MARQNAVPDSKTIDLWFLNTIHIHTTLRRILAQYSGTDPNSLRLAKGPQGKPYLIDNSLSFNISHREQQLLIAVARTGHIGVDFEIQKTVSDLEKVARMFHPTERSLLADTAPADRAAAFFRLWTRKEAVVKCLGTGLSTPLNAFSAVSDCVQIGGLSLFIHDLNIGASSSAALATDLAESTLRWCNASSLDCTTKSTVVL